MLWLCLNPAIREREKKGKGLTNDAVAKQDEAKQLYEAFRQSAGDMGFDVFSPDSVSYTHLVCRLGRV